MAHKPQLDGLRFLAFLAVFIYHARESNLPWGWAGVQFFFALSGFLITRILLSAETGNLRADLRRYYIRRTLRIFPLYYGVIALVAWSGGLNWAHLGYLVTYTYNIRAYFERYLDHMLGHFWTLCVEEQFYLLYPLALLLTPRRGRMALVVALIAGTLGFQYYAHLHMFLPSARILLPYLGEDLLWGCLAALIEVRTRAGRHEGKVCLALGIGALVLAWNTHEHRLSWPILVQDLGSVSLFGIGSALVVFGAWRTTDRWIVGPLSWAPVAYLGRISYGLYAFHIPILTGRWVEAIPFGFMIPKPYGALALTIGFAAASWRFYEGPINRLKERFAPRAGAEPDPTPATDPSTAGMVRSPG